MTELTPAQAAVLEGAPPAPPGWLEITGILEAQEIMRSPKIGVVAHQEVDRQYRGGAAIRMDGAAHSLRRKTLNRLVRRDGHTWYRDKVLYPTFARNLEEVFRGRAPGTEVPIDLIAFSERVSSQLAAALIGFDRLDTDDGLAEFNRLNTRTQHVARRAPLEILYHDIDESAIPSSLDAWQELTDRFFTPSLARRHELLRKVETGELAEEELPRDLLTLIAAHADPTLSGDPVVGMREAMMNFSAASGTSAQALARAVHHLTAWFKTHPEDRSRLGDPDFLLAVTNETLRMGANQSLLLRRAIEDLVLSSGREIKAGQYVIIRNRAASRDPLFGPDAGEFNPYRRVPDGMYPYGLAFGSGPHMCFGMPLVLGNEGIDGSLVHMLKRLYEVGVRPDPSGRPTMESHERADMPDKFGTYPVLLGASRAAT